MKTLPPGSIIGILGGGQLGRMTSMAAARLGYRCHIFCPDASEPAVEVSAFHTKAAFTDHAALEKFAKSVDVVTLEWAGKEFRTQSWYRHSRFCDHSFGCGVRKSAEDISSARDFEIDAHGL